MEKFKVDLYKKEDGTKPVGQFIRSLDIKMKAKVVANMHLLEEYGNMAREPLSKDLGDGIFELRTIEGNDIVRVLYFFDKDKIIIATNGFVKNNKRRHEVKLSWQRIEEQIIIAERRLELMSDLQELTDELMQDPEFVKEYEAIQPEVNITRAILDARINAGMTQMELSQKSGISQADISRLEKGTRNPSLNLLKRLAEAMDSTLSIEFIPNKKAAQ